jgi:hypothetical protein
MEVLAVAGEHTSEIVDYIEDRAGGSVDIAIGRCVTLRVDQCAAAVLQRGEKCLLFEGSEVSA